MAYIGTKPADKPLTAADITDSIITSAKIVDGTIVNADINASAAIASTKLSGVTAPAAFRNIVINGDMQIAQRSTSKASITTSGYYTLDRWFIFLSSLGTWTQSQSTDVPSGYGFPRSFKMDCTTADASPSASDRLMFRQPFEGQMLQYLKKGTASAVSLTASFWVKSTKTGTFIIELADGDNGRSISKSYTVNTTNTWEFKTVTFDGDTTGALDNDNAESFALNFWLGAGTDFTSGTLATSWGTSVTANRAVGQVNIADSTSNDWLITGIQLEAGTSATDFEFLPIDVDLARCQRYYEKTYPLGTAPGSSTTSQRHAGSTDSGANFVIHDRFCVKKRATPTLTVYTDDGVSGSWAIEASGFSTTATVNSYGTNDSRAGFYFAFGGARNFVSAWCAGSWVADSELS
jgi:hypothetical protein